MLPEETDSRVHVVELGSYRNISVGGKVTGGLCGCEQALQHGRAASWEKPCVD